MRIRSSRLLTAAAVALGLALPLAVAEPAAAYPDAKVDQQIRPNFGGLINPPLKPRYRPDRWKPGRYKWGKRPYRPGYPGNGYPDDDGYYDDYPRDQQVAVVDCGDTGLGPTPVSDALRTVADGGILYIRGSAACTETILVENPVVIAGQGASIFSGEDPAPATIKPQAGAACVRVASGVKGVELRDLNFVAEQAGRSACIEAWDAEVALVRTNISYWGDSSAVFVSGGRLIMRDSVVEARTWDAAIVADGVQIDIGRTRVSGEAAGLDLTPGNGESRLDQVGIVSRGGEQPGDVGILVRGLRSGTGQLTVRNAVVCGWRTALHLERGTQVDVARSRLCRSQRGVVSAGANVEVRESAIGSTEIGVYLSSGRARFAHNRFYGGGRGAYAEPGAILDLEDNWYYSDIDCWRQRLDRGLYCVTSRNLPAGLRNDDSGWTPGRRRGWEDDGYERGYMRDGRPTALPPATPPPEPPRRDRRRR